jgi:hypothetical protein
MNTKHLRPTVLGTTFSQLQCHYLGLDYKEVLKDILAVSFDAYRIAAYWNEIEAIEGQYDFTILDDIVSTIEQKNKTVILSVGIKSPRWPEFHIPIWLRERYELTKPALALDSIAEIAQKGAAFTETVVKRYTDTKAVKYFLIENESLSKIAFTAGQHLSVSFVKSEIDKARACKRADQKIMMNSAIDLWPLGEGEDADSVSCCKELADSVGINIYTKVPVGPDAFAQIPPPFNHWLYRIAPKYITPTWLYWWKLNKWRQSLERHGRETWITETQAEPWESGSAVHTAQISYPSASPQGSVELVSKLTKMGFQNILMWGCEYWYWHRKNNRNEWWNTISEFTNTI